MAGPNLNQSLLGGNASYQASDWGQASASAKLDLLATAELRRGINLGLGAESLVQLSGSVRKFIAADATAQANAAVRVQAQVQVPLDLFSEAGFALRLQAVAEAAAGITVGIGLTVGDFLALAGADPRMEGAPLRLLALLLEPGQVTITAGVKAKAAASAMAYANFLVTGSLAGAKPGFLVAAEAGLGLKAGAGYQVFANFGLTSPHRFIRRSIDIAVDETVRLVSAQVTGGVARQAISELRAPAKIAFRVAFETGWALAENGGVFNANAGPQLAQRVCIVILEEGQRLLLETLINYAGDAFQQLLEQTGISQQNWDAADPARTQLADKLRQMPDDPFEASQANRDYWTGVATSMARLSVQLGASVASQRNEFAAILWSAVQLLFVGTERISNLQVRGAVIGAGANTRTVAFDRALPAQPPSQIRDTINTALGLSQGSSISEGKLVDFLIRDAVIQPLIQAAPNLKTVLDIVFGPAGGTGAAAARTLLREAGAFVPGPNGAVSSVATLRALLNGLQAYAADRLKDEVLPIARQALAGNRELRLYLDEVLMPAMDFTVRLLMERVLAWSQNVAADQAALREACSGILLKLTSRSLVVSLDVLLNTALSGIQAAFRDAAAHVNDNKGIAQVLSGATGLDRGFVADLLEETLLISAETFGPLAPERRERIRSLLYQVADVIPAGSTDEVLSNLKDSFFVPNLEAAVALVGETGDLIADTFGRFIEALFYRLARLILEELQEVFEAGQAQIEQWLTDLQRMVDELAAALRDLERRIGQLTQEVESAWNEAFDALESLLSIVGGAGRLAVRRRVKAALVARALAALADNDVYRGMPRPAKRFAEDRLSDAVGEVLNNELFNDLWDVVASVSAAAAELMEDIRDLDLDSNLTGQISSLVLDRVEDAIRDWFGGGDPRVPIAFYINLDLGFFRISQTISLGTVRLPLDRLLDAVREGVGGLSAFERAVRVVASRIATALEASSNLQTAEGEKQAAEVEHGHARAELDGANGDAVEIQILSPSPSGFYETSTVELELFLKHVPCSYLGLGALEQQRVTVFLNRRELEPRLFVVEEHTGPTSGPTAPIQLGGRVGLGLTDHSFRAAGTAQPRSPTLRFQPGTATGPWGQTFLLEEPVASTRERLRMFLRQQGKTLAAKPGARERTVFSVRAKGNLPRSSPVLAGSPLLGRTPSVRARLEKLESLGAGLLLRLSLPASGFVEGVNTLAVAVIPGRSPRVERSVSFAVFRNEKSPAKLTIPNSFRPTRDVPVPELLRAFGGDPKPLRREEGVPLPAKGSWLPPKKNRAAEVKAAIDRRAARAGETRAAVAERMAKISARSLAGVPVFIRDEPTTKGPREKPHAQS